MMRTNRKHAAFAVVAPAAGLLLGSCATFPIQSGPFQLSGFSLAGAIAAPPTIQPDPAAGGKGDPQPLLAAMTTLPGRKLLPVQERLLAGAEHFLGKSELVYGGRTYTYDCTGTILAIYAYAGIDLLSRFNHYSGNGVQRLYKIMSRHDLLTKTDFPQPGDIVFWDNTYDANGDGLWDDPLTHAGMVVGVTPSGEISYIHENYAKGIVIEKMNLIHPSIYTEAEGGATILINSPMRMRGQPPGPDWLSGQLFRVFGKGYLLAG